MGADAVIEVFCGENVESFWRPSQTSYVPMFGPNGQIMGGTYSSSPAGTTLSGWKLMGLAVKFKD